MMNYASTFRDLATITIVLLKAGQLERNIRFYCGAFRHPGYVHVDVVVGLAALNSSLQLFDNPFYAALVETVIVLAGTEVPTKRGRDRGI